MLIDDRFVDNRTHRLFTLTKEPTRFIDDAGSLTEV